jgi:hypothetical protein
VAEQFRHPESVGPEVYLWEESTHKCPTGITLMPETGIPWIYHLSPQPWFELYASAVLELQPERLIERVDAAEAASELRLRLAS